MEKEGHQVNDYTDKNTDYTDDGDYNHEDYTPELEAASKRQKCHTPEQIRELRAAYQQCDHPDEPTLQALGAKIGLDARQVQCWFQNQRSKMQAKALVQKGKVSEQENTAGMTENTSLHQAMQSKQYRFTCGGKAVPVKLPAENQGLVTENARLIRDENMRAATAVVTPIQLPAPPPAERPPAVVARGRPAVLSIGAGSSMMAPDRPARLRAHAEAAMEQFLLLATEGAPPLWVRTPDGGEVLSYLRYQNKELLPVHHGLFPDDGFIVEATRATGIVRAHGHNLVAILTNAKHWAEMFPGIVAGVIAKSHPALSSGVAADSNIQLMKAELQVHSPRLLNRRVSFLRYTKPVAERRWAVMDVSMDGILGPAVANNTGAPASYTGCRLLPSGCLIEDMGKGLCKVTWVMHAEYDESTVPTMFRPMFRSGKALGAHRWLASLQRQCEHFALLHSSQVPSGNNTASAISSMGKRGVLELAQRMMAVFYSAVAGPVTQPSSKVCEWSAGSGTGARRTEATVRMVTWKKAGGEANQVLSASTTVWLPNTPPQHVFEYLCDRQRRAEWDVFANGAAVTELCSVATGGHLQDSAVSVLCSNLAYGSGTDSSKKVVILQQACTDASCSMVVHAPLQEDFMRAVMNGGDHASVFLVPYGFAILPDGRGRACHAPSSSSAVVRYGNTAGSLLTVACQTRLPGSSSSDNLAADFQGIGNLLCRALKKIKAAVQANMVIPA